jgi:hypothetical protein
MKKAKYNEIPKEYRKDYKKIILNLGAMALLSLAFSVLLMLGIVYC